MNERLPWSGPHFPDGKNGWCDDIACQECNRGIDAAAAQLKEIVLPPLPMNDPYEYGDLRRDMYGNPLPTSYATNRLRWVERVVKVPHQSDVVSPVRIMVKHVVHVLQQEWLVGDTVEWRDVPTETEQTADRPVVCEGKR